MGTSERRPAKPPDNGAPATVKKRIRDPEAHRAAILAAARAELTERGYARTTIRDIARRAGVTHGLVMRHFGSKEQLLIAALPGPRDLEHVVTGDPQGLPRRIAAAFVERMETGFADDALVALIRSAASGDDTATKLYLAIEQQSAAAYRKVLVGDDVDIRIDLLGVQLIGVAFTRYIVKAGALSDVSAEDLVEYLTAILKDILGPVIPCAGPLPAASRESSPGSATWPMTRRRSQRNIGSVADRDVPNQGD